MKIYFLMINKCYVKGLLFYHRVWTSWYSQLDRLVSIHEL